MPAQRPIGDEHQDHDTEASRITTIDELKQEQDRQGGILDRLVQLVEGRGPAAPVHDAAQQRVERKLGDPGHITEIKQALRDVQAEDAAASASAAHDAEHARLKQGPAAEAEQAPREAARPAWKQRMQTMLFGPLDEARPRGRGGR
jgi:hypothetical protein